MEEEKKVLQTLDVEAYYLDDKKDMKKGVFVVRLPTMGELTQLYKLCQKKNLRTGQVIETDDVQFSKYRIAVAIVDCPLISELKQWKELTLQAKTSLLEGAFQEDTFFEFNKKLKELHKYEDTENMGNLSEPQ